MPIQTISAAKAAKKWTRKAAASTPDYISGVDTPRIPWSTAAKASEENYKLAVVAAAGAGKFGKGITKAGDQAWQEGCQKLGKDRWAPGIASSQAKFGAGIAGVLATIGSLTLPPRGVKGNPANLNRVAIIANALHAKKIAG